MRKGWIKLYRQIQNNWIWETSKPFDKRSAWIDILLSANYKSRKVNLGNELIGVEKGEFITSQVKLAEKWGWSRTKVRNFLDLLEKDGMIKKQVKNNKRTHLKVCNYGDYQHSENSKKTGEKQEENRSSTGGKQVENTDKNVKNVKNEKNVSNNGGKFDLTKKENGRYKYPDGFEKIWSKYPYKRGSKKSAWRKWKARRKEGVENDLLLEAVENYTQQIDKQGTDKQFVKHAKTFFGPDEWWREYIDENFEQEQEKDVAFITEFNGDVAEYDY